MPREDIEEYLEAVYDLSGKNGIAKTSRIALRLKVSPASVTEALKRMNNRGLVNYKPYKGASLTESGLGIALKIKRKHRLLECFFHDVLKIRNSHKQSCEMEHYLSDKAERSLSAFLGNPEKCPDGKEIPGHEPKKKKNGNRKIIERLMKLNELEAGGNGRIMVIKGEEKTIQRLSDLGLTIGTKISVVSKAPMKGPIKVLVRGSHIAVSREIAEGIYICAQ